MVMPRRVPFPLPLPAQLQQHRAYIFALRFHRGFELGHAEGSVAGHAWQATVPFPKTIFQSNRLVWIRVLRDGAVKFSNVSVHEQTRWWLAKSGVNLARNPGTGPFRDDPVPENPNSPMGFGSGGLTGLNCTDHAPTRFEVAREDQCIDGGLCSLRRSPWVTGQD